MPIQRNSHQSFNLDAIIKVKTKLKRDKIGKIEDNTFEFLNRGSWVEPLVDDFGVLGVLGPDVELDGLEVLAGIHPASDVHWRGNYLEVLGEVVAQRFQVDVVLVIGGRAAVFLEELALGVDASYNIWYLVGCELLHE